MKATNQTASVAVALVAVLVFLSASNVAADVVSFDSQTFPEDEALLSTSKPLFVMFHAPWCGHCKNLAPIWEEAASSLDDSATFAKVDATAHPDLALRFGVDAYPTLKLFSTDGLVYSYAGGRTVADLKAFVEGGFAETVGTELPPAPVPVDPSTPSAVQILTDENFEHLTQAATGATTGTWFVEFYAPWCAHCKNLALAWEAAAIELKGEIVFAKVDATVNPEVSERFSIKGFPTLMVLHHGKMYNYNSGDRSTEALVAFARGGFAKADAEPVPPVPTWMDHAKKRWEWIKADFATLAQYKKGVLAITFVIGFGFGLLVMGILWQYVSKVEPATLNASRSAEESEEAEDSPETKKSR